MFVLREYMQNALEKGGKKEKPSFFIALLNLQCYNLIKMNKKKVI